MFLHNIKFTFRKFKKEKSTFLINLVGLSIGFTCAMLIGMWVLNEWSFDKYHNNADQIYRLNVGSLVSDSRSAVSSGAMAPAFAPDFPEVKNYVRFRKVPSLVEQEAKRFYEDQFFYTDSTVFEVFDFELIKGNKEEVLAAPFNIVLTESVAQKYFGDEEPIGKSLKIDNQFDFLVTGVMKDVPQNSHFHFDLIASIASLRTHPNESVRYWQLNSWYSHYYHTYLLLHDKTNVTTFSQKIERIAKDYSNPEFYELYGQKMGLYLQPMASIHLNPIHGEMEEQGQLRHIYILSIVALFILLIACSNYANLAAATALKRTKEIGVRKVIGAGKRQLALQFFKESLLLSGIAISLALIFLLPLANIFEEIVGYDFKLDWSIFPLALGMFFFTGLLGGWYPAFIGASFQPASIFRNVQQKFGGLPVIKGLLVFQFVLSFFLLVSTVVVFQQMNFMQNQPLGMNMEQMVVIPTRNNSEVTQQYSAFENELKKLPEISSTTISELVPGQEVFGFTCRFEGMEAGRDFSTNPVGYDYFKTYGIETAAGRVFSRDIASDTLERAVINETLARQLGWQNPQDAIGKKFDFANDGENVGEVIGVVKDFHFHSLQFDIRPLLFIIEDHFYRNVSLRLATTNLPATIAKVEKTWQQFFPELPFEYFFADEHFGRQYHAEQHMAKLFFYLVSLAIFLTCLGLFGLSTLAMQRRKKEISIRKVLGANAFSLIRLFSSDFVKMVFMAVLIGLPLSYFIARKWLNSFAFRIDLSFWIFLISGIVVLLITFITISLQTMQAANVNPVNNLKE